MEKNRVTNGNQFCILNYFAAEYYMYLVAFSIFISCLHANTQMIWYRNMAVGRGAGRGRGSPGFLYMILIKRFHELLTLSW